jgi:hypothetical protein
VKRDLIRDIGNVLSKLNCHLDDRSYSSASSADDLGRTLEANYARCYSTVFYVRLGWAVPAHKNNELKNGLSCPLKLEYQRSDILRTNVVLQCLNRVQRCLALAYCPVLSCTVP